MFERFTDRARRVIVLAQEEACSLNHNYISTEHLWLGLIAEGEGVGAQALAQLDVDFATVRGTVLSLIGQGEATPMGHIPFTSRAKKAMELSLRESLQLGHNYIGTEHLLLALIREGGIAPIREGEGVACQALIGYGLDLTRIRQQVIQILSEGHTRSSTGCMKLQVDRYVNGPDSVTVTFDLPRGTLKGIRAEAIAAEVKDFIAKNEWAQGRISDHHSTTFTGIVRTVTGLKEAVNILTLDTELPDTG